VPKWKTIIRIVLPTAIGGITTGVMLAVARITGETAPVMMLVFMYNFPSGVVLYWTVTNVLSGVQQYLVNLAEDRKMAASA